MIKYNDYNHHCDYTWCVSDYLINCHTPGIIAEMIVVKSIQASSKISGRKVTFVHNCAG